MHGERYLGNQSRMEVHDLENEKPDCQIDAIIAAGDEEPFNILALAHAMKYKNCACCLGGPTR